MLILSFSIQYIPLCIMIVENAPIPIKNTQNYFSLCFIYTLLLHTCEMKKRLSWLKWDGGSIISCLQNQINCV
jgi:hypothetical protein